MDNKFSYTIVGFFVVLFSIITIGALFWLSSASLREKNYHNYVMYFHESVSGLTINAPVKYNGVIVGFVKDMMLDANDPSRVEIDVGIEGKIPIHTDTHALLVAQGVTGLLFINLTGGTPQSPLLTRQAGEKAPVIETIPSLIVRLDTAMQTLSHSVSKASDQISALLNPANQAATSKLLHQTADASTELAPLISQLRQTTAHADRMLQNFQYLMQSLQQLTQELMQNPSVLIRGRIPPPPGPGEK